MALPDITDISKTGSETGETVADKVNNAFDHIRQNENDYTALDTRVGTTESDINTLETTTIPDIQTDISSLETEKLSIADMGLLAIRANNDLVNSLTTSYTKIRAVDTQGISQANGHMTYSIPNDNLTINTTGVYKLRASGTMTAPTNEEVTFSYFLNGVEINSGGNPVFIGRGTGTPVPIYDSNAISFSANDVLEIRAKATGNVDITIKSMDFQVEKTPY